MKKNTLFFGLITMVVIGSTCAINLELFVALAKTALYLGGTTFFVLMPFFLFKGEKKTNENTNKEVPQPMLKRKINSVKTTLLEKGEKETTYMSIYRVNNSP
ncbi:hypothetical protein [Flammeovirga aprica]|uniref:Uncharacterized protein n=1 Tax=Flammeovirga aprica JL-4 TaxID=694437 RepID=A0A7X9RUQ5_9BACT|nr:hypothetical protein [Flammeovirga aprica]NME69065.1 hypothetical protein [Flammeovirga aprica JL-4]